MSIITFTFEREDGSTYESAIDEKQPMWLAGGEFVLADLLTVGDDIVGDGPAHVGGLQAWNRVVRRISADQS